MNRRDWLLVFSPLLLIWSIDRFTKEFMSEVVVPHTFGILTFITQHNHGAMLGLFTELPSVLRIVTLATSGSFIISAYAVIQYFLPSKFLLLRIGLSILVGGILGNVADRIMYGYVIDFILFKSGTYHTPVFNLADAFQWLGYVIIIYCLAKEGKKLWPEQEHRNQYWVNKLFQLKYSLLLVGIGVSISIITLVFAYTYLRVTMSELIGNNEYLMQKFLTPFVVSYILITLTFCGILFLLGKYITHRIAGPIYAFERFLNAAFRGQVKPLKLRDGDDFKHLEALSVSILEKINTTQINSGKGNSSQTEARSNTEDF